MASESLRAHVERARARREKAADAIYAAAYPRRDVVFSECRKLAAPDVVAAWDEAQRALDQIEEEAISKGRAWRASFGLLVWRN